MSDLTLELIIDHIERKAFEGFENRKLLDVHAVFDKNHSTQEWLVIEAL